ncbi:uncharacterized protein LOC108655736 [Drosophila navojoa]|nr:uncharacterized protein LOC108655736 [Drosophila navojoa]
MGGICSSRTMSTMLQPRRIVCLLLALLPLRAELATYDVFLDEDIFQESCDPREDRGNVALSELLENNLTSVLIDDTSYITGEFIVKAQLPPGRIKLEADIRRQERGRWVPTFISIKRDDFCKALFDPFELWHFFIITNVPRSQRICPPKKGHVYTFRNISNRMHLENMPRWNILGNVKVVMHLSVGNLTTCAALHCTVSED